MLLIMLYKLLIIPSLEEVLVGLSTKRGNAFLDLLAFECIELVLVVELAAITFLFLKIITYDVNNCMEKI